MAHLKVNSMANSLVGLMLYGQLNSLFNGEFKGLCSMVNLMVGLMVHV